MSKFRVTFYDKDENETTEVGVYDSYEKAVEEAFEYANDECDGYFDNDEDEDVKNALMSHGFYVMGYGNSSIDIEEV